MAHVLAHALGMVAFAALLAAAGVVVQRLAPALRAWRGDTDLLSVVLGSVAWVALLFALAAAQALRPAVIWGAVLVLGSGGLLVALRRPRPGPWKPEWTTVALTALAATVVLSLFVADLVPDVGWDDSAYHLTVPRLWLEHGGFRRIPFNVPSNWPLSVELLYGLAMALQDYRLARLVHWFFLVCTLVLAHRFTRRLTGSGAAGSVAACLVLANPVVLFEAGQANVDIALAFFLLFGFVALERREELPPHAAVIAAGLCGGLAAASKISGMFVPMALVPVAWMQRAGRRRGREAFLGAATDTFWLAGLSLLVALPWYVKSYLQTGDPWYPALYPLLGGVEWSQDLHTALTAWNRSIGMGRAPSDYVLLPARVMLSSGWGYDRFHGPVSRSWVLWVPLAIAACRRSPTVARALVASAVYFVLWAAVRQETRYLIPILPLLAVAAAQALWLLVLQPLGENAKANGRVAGTWAAAAVLVAVQALLLWSARGTIRQAVGAARSIVVEGRTSEEAAMTGTERFIASALPAGSRLLLLNTNQGFFIRRDYVSDSFFEASQLNDLLWRDPSADGIRRTLASLGATHVLWFAKDWGIPYPSALLALLQDPRHVRVLHQAADGAFVLCELR
jgi:Dolichyl-phosphate-mannose-protein mannosyltransferase